MHHVRNKIRKVRLRIHEENSNTSNPVTPAESIKDSDEEPQALPKLESIPKRLWNQAYDNLRESETEKSIVKTYEEILTKYLQSKPDQSYNTPSMQNLVNEDPDKRWQQMEKMVKDGLEKTAKDSGRKEAINDWLTMIQPLKSAINTGIKAAPEAAIPWVGICCALEILASPLTESKKNRDGATPTGDFQPPQIDYAWQRQERHKEKDDNCLKDLYITNPRHVKESLLSAKGGLVHESFYWVTQHPKYREWQENNTRRLLWIRGDAGKGKSMLLCGIIEELEQSAPETVFYFFCQASEPKLRSATNVLRGLIWSLARTRPSLISYIREEYDHTGGSLFQDTNAWQSLSEILTKILEDSAAMDCIFVIDALDECTEHMDKLIDLVSRLSMRCNARWIVSSRNWSTIEKQLDNVTMDMQLRLELNSAAISDAVQRFINIKINELAINKGYSETLRTEIYEHLVANADDTFLWVALVCTELGKHDVPFYLALEVAKSFPPGLEELYHRMMTVMDESRSRRFCIAVLAVVTLAFRPLKLSELGVLDKRLEAVSQNPEALSDIVSSCGSMVAIREDTTVHIVHQSAKEYLMKSSMIFPLEVSQQHTEIFVNSMAVMQKKLHRNIYQLEQSTFLIDEITAPFPNPLEGAQSQEAIRFGLQSAFDFLYNETIKTFQKLKNLVLAGPDDLMDSIEDALRWALMHRSVMDAAPLQLYDSALLFSPQQSAIRRHFATEAPVSINLVHSSFQKWDPCLHTIANFAVKRPWLEFSPDRTKLATIKEDSRTILILDALTGDHLVTFPPETEEIILSVSYHPGGKHLASLSNFKRIKIWDIDKKECIQSFEPRAKLKALRFSSWSINYYDRLPFSTNGHFLATSGAEQGIEIWDLWNKTFLDTLYSNELGETEWFDWGLNSSGTPLLLAIRSMEGASQIDLWNPESREWLSGPLDSTFNAAEVSRDARRLAVATDEGITIMSWDPSLIIQKVVDEGAIGNIHDLSWAADGQSLAIATEHGITLWDLTNGAKPVHITGQASHVSTLRYGRDNQLASIGDRGRTLRIWDVNFEPGHPVIEKGLLTYPPLSMTQSSQEELAVVLPNGDIQMASAATGQISHKLIFARSYQLHSYEFGPNHSLATLSTTGIAMIWDLISGDCIQEFEAYDEEIINSDRNWPVEFCFGNSGELITVAKRVKIWNIATGSYRYASYSFEPAKQRAVACSKDGRLAFSWNDSQVAIWRPNWAEERQHLCESHNTWSLSFNTTGLLAVQAQNSVSIWNSEDGTVIRKYRLPEMITYLSFDLRYSSGLDVEFGMLDVDITGKDRPSEKDEPFEEPTWCPQSLRLDWTETSAWLMRGSSRVLWVPRGSVNRELFTIKTNPETGLLASQWMRFQALSNSVSLAAGQIGDIVHTVNPPKDAKVSKNLIAIILGATVGEFGAAKELLGNWQMKLVVAGIQGLAAQGGGIITWLGNKNSNNYLHESMQISDISASLSGQVKDYHGTLGTAIKTAQGNVTQLLALTKEGGFSQRGLTSLTAQMDSIYKDLVNFIYSSALQANGIFLTKQYTTDPVKMASSAGDKLVNCTGLDSNNVCDQYWALDGTTYSFSKVDDCGWRFTEMWYTTLQKGWLTPQTLFLGSDACAGNQPFFDGTAFTMNCTSYTPNCVYTTDAEGQFQNCPNQNNWMHGYWKHKVP
ncbi:vegetatible incompatibility het-E-1 [Fusarium beomiforme]|uniref:Vegetatible incompatibility het-E-1 n=1 Tax=Fusarium beomiforme TaxID=44412 RepID=A0A9P5DTJ9_9HYPO|nr:vegetatible incompatibility het-E-1 [Fusarium beomiforme]